MSLDVPPTPLEVLPAATGQRRAAHQRRGVLLGCVALSVWAAVALGLTLARPLNPQAPTPRLPPRLTHFHIDLNTATTDDLTLLPGIGPTLAQSIVTHREQTGPFTHLAQLDQIHRIGPKTRQRLTPWITPPRKFPPRNRPSPVAPPEVSSALPTFTGRTPGSCPRVAAPGR